MDTWTNKKPALASVFGEIISSIRIGKNKSNIEITLSKRELPRVCHYSKMKELLRKPYSFIVGESLKGPIVQQIADLPHMLIAGTSGGGKSVFMNNVILGLLHSSKRIKFYLLDLKKGVEVQQYEDFPNIEIANNEYDAVEILEKLNKEMARRFEYMKQRGIKKIDPKRDNMDVLVCAVDEASVLYGVDKSNKARNEVIQLARDYTHNLARLARACGIHLILATQKVTKQTIDTNVQGNTKGKMCFKVATLASSSTVLGNKKAFELPAIAGRAIWSDGNDFLEVQAPFLSEEEINDECQHLKEKFDNKNKENNSSDMIKTDCSSKGSDLNDLEHST